MALYVSDHTRFMDELMNKNPEWAEDQKKGRALWWDKPQDTEVQKKYDSAKVVQKPYPYDNHF